MTTLLELLYLTVSFAIVSVASRQIGRIFVRLGLPAISGFLFAGILAGPYILGLIPFGAAEELRFIDEISLAFIAFAAGSELHLQELRTRLRSIAWVMAGNTLVIPILGSLAVFLLADLIPFMQEMSLAGRIAASLLAGAILVARSPSSLIAIVSELRAKGPFTQTVLGVTMVGDVVVIVLFAIVVEIADALLTNVRPGLGFVLLLLGELLLSLALGYLLGQLLRLVLSLHVDRRTKTGLILLAGYGVFGLSLSVRAFTQAQFDFELLLEPLLVSMIGAFFVTNFSPYRDEFLKVLGDTALPIYVVFFTLTGVGLDLEVVANTWPVALTLFAIRLAGVFIGSFGGGLIAGDPMLHNRLSWLVYVTQAGVSLGLAKAVAVLFPPWGDEFASTLIGVIVLSQIVGPPLTKWAIRRVGEARTRAAGAAFDGVRDALIFGVENQALALAEQLHLHGWQVKVAGFDPALMPKAEITAAHEAFEEIDIELLPELTVETMKALGTRRADAIVTLLSDEENYEICRLAYEHFGTPTLVVRLNDRANFERFRELGALIVDPGTAMVGLLDHFVRSPSAASLLVGQIEGRDIVELEVRDPTLHGRTLREVRLPLDTLVLSIQRDGRSLISHGYTELELGDRVVVMGSDESLRKIALQFDSYGDDYGRR